MNLVLRVVSGVVLIALCGAALWVGTPAVAVVVGLGAVLATWELCALLARMGTPADAWLLMPLTLWLSLRFVLSGSAGAADWALAAAAVVGLVAGVLLRRGFASWASAVGGATYIGLCLGYWIALYRWRVPDAGHLGFRLVALTLAGATLGDTVAYLAGSVAGRHRFFPTISPKKSVEGALAGAAATVLVGLVGGPWLLGIGAGLGAGLGVLMTLAAQGGDLVESAIKREAGVKDSGTLVPGHGGLLDRLDSLVLIAPVVYCYLKLIAFP